jgi:hypothetical protein
MLRQLHAEPGLLAAPRGGVVVTSRYGAQRCPGPPATLILHGSGRDALRKGASARVNPWAAHRHDPRPHGAPTRHARPGRPPVAQRMTKPPDGQAHKRGTACSQVPVRSVDAYFFQGRSIMIGKSIRIGAGTCFIM